ncbi:MAG: hypothetical protein LBS51_01600 [Oscillospiraceae bacterium]|jgi:hypothetical protein|nr:hypothetical protein [Oscillospiraceae bacterium]
MAVGSINGYPTWEIISGIPTNADISNNNVKLGSRSSKFSFFHADEVVLGSRYSPFETYKIPTKSVESAADNELSDTDMEWKEIISKYKFPATMENYHRLSAELRNSGLISNSEYLTISTYISVMGSTENAVRGAIHFKNTGETNLPLSMCIDVMSLDWLEEGLQHVDLRDMFMKRLLSTDTQLTYVWTPNTQEKAVIQNFLTKLRELS